LGGEQGQIEQVENPAQAMGYLESATDDFVSAEMQARIDEAIIGSK